jgi:lysozyme family protein
MNTDPVFLSWLTFAVGSIEAAGLTTPLDLLGEEGGWTPDDQGPGNPSWRGVSYTEACKFFIVSQMPFSLFRSKVSRTVVGQIANKNYWTPAKCGLLIPGPGLLYMDHVWNAGQGAGVRCLQVALNTIGKGPLDVDGIFGTVQTEPAVMSLIPADAAKLINALHDAIEADYRAMAKFPEDGVGWLRRNDRGRDLALTLRKAK